MILLNLGSVISFAQEIELQLDNSITREDMHFFKRELKLIPLDSGLYSIPEEKSLERKDKILKNLNPESWKYSFEMPYYDPSETFRSDMPNADVIREGIDYKLLIKPLPLYKKNHPVIIPEKKK